MLQKVLPELGYEAMVRFRTHAERLDCDVLLVAGLCRYIEGFQICSNLAAQKPITVLWQLEPLPSA